MAKHRGIRQSAVSASATAASLTARQAEVLQLAGRGLCGKQIARSLGISVRTVEDHFSAMRARTGAHSQGELIACWAATGLVRPGLAVLETFLSGTPNDLGRPAPETVPETSPETACRDPGTGTASGTIGTMTTAPDLDSSVRIGYARVSTHTQDHQAQLDALAAAHCREIIVETASSRDARPQLHRALDILRAGDTLVIYKPDRVARSMKELLILLEDQLHARGINLHIPLGICGQPDHRHLSAGTLTGAAAPRGPRRGCGARLRTVPAAGLRLPGSGHSGRTGHR